MREGDSRRDKVNASGIFQQVFPSKGPKIHTFKNRRSYQIIRRTHPACSDTQRTINITRVTSIRANYVQLEIN